MLFHLLNIFREQLESLGFYAYQEVTFRGLLAMITSFLVTFIFGKRIIKWLLSMKIKDVPDFNTKALNECMKNKRNTPTMGGIIILLSIFAGTLLWARLDNPFIRKAMFIMIWFGLLGGVDDWLKLKQKGKTRDGLLTHEKAIFQIAGALLVSLFVYFDLENIPDAPMLWLPFYKQGIYLPVWLFVILAFCYITATSNAVNLTDGMDGLAAGCTAVVAASLAFLCFVASEKMGRGSDMYWAKYLLLPHIPQAGELSVFFASMFGAILGFLWYNCSPAMVFMGDTGSLPLGAAIGYGALVTRNEVLLLIIGGVFMMELFSVMLQVGYFKYTKHKFGKGRRIFECAPLHHHFNLKGWKEEQVVVRFWLIGIICAAIAMLTLKIR
ncbi:phospho-N-acetylmuramoyl-pentapeptide-transferase [Sedimentisphaera salicampi]|uniref:Phospho-N-acetylmuramoyl-pentapeptide-transferase n=1 Tax=Sedimentisphaera salicampi TaxID=1941349 RepID=A0A1W6LNH0_9BACT|nr:phospho-N-acetylmuramoyl-pentapeptide-transferase [Sedimentisphaera salicampi]ARN57328.1 Phospho-N-acetylmuramoyl-pentapeptide- transferase [Sedimentisphaera salicampi]OXU14641.1 Phospho-N-acetylmuramoyl-pentapeptide-transferase [Sedimentisphaera salicampi]